MKQRILYVIPHQDDELLTMGVSITRSSMELKEVHVLLCSDGSRSKVRQRLNNGQTCEKHPGIHEYDLSIEEFIEARDREFKGSCKALGVREENIHIPVRRETDGSVLEEGVRDILYHDVSLKDYEKVISIYPFGSSQHKDHVAVGKAVWSLWKEGAISCAEFYLEPYCLKASLEENDKLTVREVKAGFFLKKRVKEAISSYCLWRPEEGRYAVGYHSVKRDFDDYMEECRNYLIEVSK
ncbi:MAG: PIG-L family deacetylase [Erysipelotrichaceae bacterium]|nr:PIG-L family deacetylase [Erysipelotrichaceae bacterium]